MKIFFVLLIRLYKALISPLLAPACRFHPSCSDYAQQALQKHGVLKGLMMAGGRIARCHPWGGPGGIDPVPDRFTWGGLIRYTGATRNTTKSEDAAP